MVSRSLVAVGLTSLAVLLGGCGQHMNVAFGELKATRGTDDRVTLSAAVVCEIVGGEKDCGDLGEYCVEAAWAEVAADATFPETPLAVAKACSRRAITRTVDTKDSEVLSLTSDRAVARSENLRIRVTLTAEKAVSPDTVPHRTERTISSP